MEDRERLESPELGTDIGVIALVGDSVEVTVGSPKPPGTRVALHEPGDATALVSGKVVSIRALAEEGEEGWEIRIKLFAPSKAARARLRERAELPTAG